jgi:Uncharacterized protein conserved in bacteria
MTNKEVILNLYENVFNRHDFSRIREYMHEDYVQHNPKVPSGLKGFVSCFRDGHFVKFPDFKVYIKHIIEDGNMVAVHTHAVSAPGDIGSAVVDIYRLEDGKVAEHWDVIQMIPKDSVHNNGMF